MKPLELQRGIASVMATAGDATTGQDLFRRVSERLRRIVPFDGSAWFGVDPSTLLAAAPARIENVQSGHCDSFWVREMTVEDVLLFRDVARSEAGVGTLHHATGASPARSARHREFLAPQGYDDELRAALRVGSRTWGVVSLYRDRGRPSFSPRDAEVVRQVGSAVAGALRGFATLSVMTPGDPDSPGTALWDATGRLLLSFDEQADRWLSEIAGDNWHRAIAPALTPIVAVVAHASMVAAGRERGPASTRMQAPSGRWIYAQASCLRGADGSAGPVAVTIGPAKSSQIAPIIVEAYGLTAREQQITQAVARGMANQDIAAALHLSPHTVRDHLKAIFGKLDVGTRGELTAKLFAEHYVPTLHAVDPADSHAQF
jgi:DNA-binding CsgD family transcriptional regulator